MSISGHNGTEEVLKHNWFRGFLWQRFMYRKIKAPILPQVYVHPLRAQPLCPRQQGTISVLLLCL